MLDTNTRIHFIGIGGIGMSALAQAILAKGYIVSGSDITRNNLTALIESKGGRIFKGHRKENIEGSQAVIYSSSISKENPEMVEARKKGLLILHRGQLLAELMKEKEGVAVTGAHGKTTTTAMVASILIEAGYDPLCLIGGESPALKSNAYAGKGKFLVAEADESDGSFLYLEPTFGIITNIDREHLDYYKGIDDIMKANLRFMERIKPGGAFFGLIDDESIRKLILRYDRRFATFGFWEDADLSISNIRMDGIRSEFDCIYKKKHIGRVRLNIPGRHNILNAAVSMLFALHIGIDFEPASKTLFEFKSTRRRFEIYPDTGDITVMEDYAHHPTEITATLESCRLLKPKRLVTVFQPHRYSRTKELAKEFGECFRQSDELILTNIYAASEKRIEGVTVKNIYEEVIRTGFKNVHIMPKDNIAAYLSNTSKDGDFIAVLGAGDIGGVAKDIAGRLQDEAAGTQTLKKSD